MTKADTPTKRDAGEAEGGAAAAKPARARPDRERRRAAAYLDLWERHVGHAAMHGQGVSAPWFAPRVAR